MATSNTESSENVAPSDIMLDFDANGDFKVVCLDVEINNYDAFYNVKENNLEYISNHLQSFTDVDSCIKHLTSYWFYRIFFIVSDRFASIISSEIQNMDHILSIFIICKNIASRDLKTVYPEKCRGIFTEKQNFMTDIMEHIFMKTSIFSINNVFQGVKKDQESLVHSNDTGTFSILTDVNRAARSHYEDHSISFDKQQMLRECRLYHQNNKSMIKQIDKFSKEYYSAEAINWYSRDSFLFRIVNQALRTRSTEIIDKFRFFIKDLEESLDVHFAKQIFEQWSSSCSLSNKLLMVYRGQVLSHSDLQQLRSFVGQNITMSQYISTTKNIRIAEPFSGGGVVSPGSESILYEIDTSVIYENYIDKPDPSIYYYDISHISHFPGEEEFLLRIGTTFKVISVQKLPDNIWHVMLRLEKVNDYRTKNTIHRKPIDIVQSFFRKASQKQKINVENIITEHLSSNTIVTMSVFIRLGHLVKHHPQEQLQYYQSALSLIPSNESILLEVGYWAIRMRCISSVKDWTSIPLNIYRQTVLHIDGNLRKQLHRELARIDAARGDFCSAKIHYTAARKYTNDYSEEQLISNDIKRLGNKVNERKPILLQGKIAYWYLYDTVLTMEERGNIDRQCNIFHKSINILHLSEDFSFTDLLPDINLNEHTSLFNDFSNNVKLNPIDLSVKHVFIKTLTDEPLTLTLEKNMTVRQLKETIRHSFEVPYHEKYDFCLIHSGISLIDEQKSLDDYQINDQSLIYLIHGPRIQDERMNQYEQRLYDNTGLTGSDISRKLAVEKLRAERLQANLQKETDIAINFRRNMYRNGMINAETANSAFHQFFQDNLVMSQYDDDDDADPDHLLDMTESFADECIQNGSPHIPAKELFELLCSAYHDPTNIEENNNNQQNDSDESGVGRTTQQTENTPLGTDESLFLSNCISS